MRMDGPAGHRAENTARMALDHDSVAQRLADPATRAETLDALERHSGPHPARLAAAAAPSLSDLLTLDAADVPHAVFQRVGLLRGRLLRETPPDDVPALYGAMFVDGRYAAELNSPGNVVAEAMAKGAAGLTREDALSYACAIAWWAPPSARDMLLCHKAAGLSCSNDFYAVQMTAEPLISK